MVKIVNVLFHLQVPVTESCALLGLWLAMTDFGFSPWKSQFSGAYHINCIDVDLVNSDNRETSGTIKIK